MFCFFCFFTISSFAFSFKDFILPGINSAYVTERGKKDFSFFTALCLFLPAVATLVCGWMRICTWVAAVPATPSTTVASQKLMTSESWSWKCGRSAEEIAEFLLRLTSYPADGFYHQVKNWFSCSFISLFTNEWILLNWKERSSGFNGGLCHGWLIPVALAARVLLKQEEPNCYETGFFQSSFLNGASYRSQRLHFAHNVNQ